MCFLTSGWHLSASHQVTFVPHQDDRCVLGRTEAAQGYPELRGSQERRPVCHRVQQQVGITCLHVALLGPFIVSLKNRQIHTVRCMFLSTEHWQSDWHMHCSDLCQHLCLFFTSASHVSSTVRVAGSPSTWISFSHTSSKIIQTTEKIH